MMKVKKIFAFNLTRPIILLADKAKNNLFDFNLDRSKILLADKVNLNEKDYQRKTCSVFFSKIHDWWVQEHGGEHCPFSCALQRNIADMLSDEAAKYCEENNVQSALPKIIKTGFSAINAISFFIAGPDEIKRTIIQMLTSNCSQPRAVYSPLFARGLSYQNPPTFKCFAGEAKGLEKLFYSSKKVEGHYKFKASKESKNHLPDPFHYINAFCPHCGNGFDDPKEMLEHRDKCYKKLV